MPATLDVVIGTVFVFLLFSLVVSAANEIWLAFLDRRAQFLKEGLQELLRDSGGNNDVIKADDILQHGLISALARGTYKPGAASTEGVPSYIPGKSFVLALLSEIQKKAGLAQLAEQDLRGAISKLENKELKETLLALLDDSQGQLVHFKANLENWFNESMGRVSGWYTRYAKQWLLGFGLVLAVFGNVDTIHIAQTLAEPKNEALRKAIVDQATDYAKNPANEPSPVRVVAAPKPATAAEQAPSAESTASADTTAATQPTAAAESTSAAQPSAQPSPSGSPVPMPEVQRFKAALAELQGTGLPLGWSGAQRNYLYTQREGAAPGVTDFDWSRFLSAIIGWILTALAASLGAPFWFDMLNRFVDIRGNGRAPEEKDPTATKKQSTGVESYVVTGDSLRTDGTPATAAQQTGINVQSGAAGGTGQ